MDLNALIDKVKNIFNLSDKKEWLIKLIDDVEKRKDNFESLPFRVVELKNAGFSVKVNGLFAFISFHHMPWKYTSTNSWIAVAPHLINKRFFCKIHLINREPLKIVINGDVPQFKKPNLVWGGMYKGVIIGILECGLLIDIGYHFDWHCGSIVGLIHKSQLEDHKKLEDHTAGAEIIIAYVKSNEDGRHLFSIVHKKKVPQLNSLPFSKGSVVQAKVIDKTDGNKTYLLIEDKYEAVLVIEAKTEEKKQLMKKLQTLQTIIGQISSINKKDGKPKVKWLFEREWLSKNEDSADKEKRM